VLDIKVKSNQVWTDMQTRFEIKVDRANKKHVFFHRRTGGGPEIRIALEDFLKQYRLTSTLQPAKQEAVA